jgi:hypothetical protein
LLQREKVLTGTLLGTYGDLSGLDTGVASLVPRRTPGDPCNAPLKVVTCRLLQQSRQSRTPWADNALLSPHDPFLDMSWSTVYLQEHTRIITARVSRKEESALEEGEKKALVT